MKLFDLFEGNEQAYNWHSEPEQRNIDDTRRARLYREREPKGSEAIDARLRAQNDHLAQYAQSGNFWLKQKDTQEHISDAFVGKAAANAAALELLKQRPELKGNLVITAYGPGEQQGVAEASPDTTLNLLKGLKSWQVVIRNNYYRGKYSDYSGRYYYVLASSPEEARQVVLDNADAILQELLAMKSHNGKKILPRGSALRITADRIGEIRDGTEAGRMSTAGFKKMYSPQGPMMVKLSNGAVADIQGQEQGVAEESALDRVRDKLSSQGYASSQQDRLRDRERSQEKLDAVHQSFLNRQQTGRQKDDAMTQHEIDVLAHRLQRMQKDDDDHERTMDMFRDRLNRYQYSTQRDVDPEQLAAISNIQYQPRRKKSDFVPKNEGAELDKFKTKSGKFPEPRERKPGQALSKSETLGRDGKIYHWQDPRAKQGVAEGDPGYNKHSFVGKIRRGIEADNKGWGQLGQLFAADNEKDAEKALRKGNRYYNMTRGSNKTPGGFPKTTVEGQGVAEGKEEMVGFHLDSERAYEAVMARFGHVIDHDEDSGIMYVPERLWPTVEAVAYDADGIGAQRDDDLENPEHYGVAEAPGAETLSHNQSTVASNLSSLDLGEGDISQLEKDIAAAPVAPIANMEGDEKIGGRYDADDFDAMVMRLKKLAGSGPMRTVYDPNKRVYKNVPAAQQPPQQPKK